MKTKSGTTKPTSTRRLCLALMTDNIERILTCCNSFDIPTENDETFSIKNRKTQNT